MLKDSGSYALPWQQGEVFLHGACAGWFSKKHQRGFIFIRPLGKCFIWDDGTAPVPGEWPTEKLSPVDLSDDFPTYAPFISWLLDHETWICAEMGSAYRRDCYRKYKALPKSRPWLTPDDVVSWLHLFIENPNNTPRAKWFAKSQAA